MEENFKKDAREQSGQMVLQQKCTAKITLEGFLGGELVVYGMEKTVSLNVNIL